MRRNKKLTRLNSHKYYKLMFIHFDDLVEVTPDYKNNVIIYRRYLQSTHETIDINLI